MDRTLACGAGNVGSIPTESTNESTPRRGVLSFVLSEEVVGRPLVEIESRRRDGAEVGSRKFSAENYL